MANIGRAPTTIDAYGRAVEDHLRFCAAEGTDPLPARADTVAVRIRDMLDRPSRRPSKAPPRTETGWANATIQQRLVAVRSFYEYLTEDGLREQNPVLPYEALAGSAAATASLPSHRASPLDPQRGCLAADPGRLRSGVTAQSSDGHARP